MRGRSRFFHSEQQEILPNDGEMLWALSLTHQTPYPHQVCQEVSRPWGKRRIQLTEFKALRK